MNRSLSAFLLILVAGLTSLPACQAQFENLLQHLPEDANTLMLFNMEEIMATPLAASQNWKNGEAAKYSSGLMIVPPQTLHLAMAAQMDIELMQPHWHASVMDLSEEPSMLTVTERHGGNVDTISGQDAAVLPNNTYVVKFGKFIAGTMYPADRQQTARWVDSVFATSGRKPLSPYLAEAEGYADQKKVPIVLAMDLKNVLSAKFIRHRLDLMKSLKGTQVDLDKLAEALSSVRGITLGIEITDRITGGIKVDFDGDVSLMKDVAKPLLLESLGNHGAMINELNDWKVSVSRNEILLQGSFQSSGIQRVFSLFDAPPGMQSLSQTSSPGDAKSGKDLTARATQQYFKSIQLLISDLQHEDQEHQSSTPGLEAMWYARYAAKIDALPILHVDPEMVTFATQVSAALRQSQTAMRTAGVQTATRITSMQGAQVYNYQYAAGAAENYGIFGGGYAYRYQANPRASLRQDGAQVAQIEAQETSRGYETANKIMQEIAVSTTQIRRKMTEKYQIEF
ncbi:hypothetical protein Q31b_10400 [Novipirellula aureliae]|uniref:Uncharacterized protein n=1 Tax=Novipirellula aureliae TaxID=2527966 RepID=A0A5C6EBR7_9BACT|nr:hypothetical protein [Novipirellula aureliae]TWU45864.1 hypothetical protein Q31b_10400 [Novipirellula aureliae]